MNDVSARERLHSVETLAEQAFSRAAGAPLIEGNSIRLLVDARENYPAWLEAIGQAQHCIHFESYIIYDDEAGAMFADALIAKARDGVRVRVLYDWVGAFGKSSKALWSRLRAGGVEVRCYNPPRFASPLGWISRDHRKTISIDGRIGVVAGLCIGKMWLGDPERQLEPWRDTGVLVRGPAAAEVERGFAEVWATIGEPIPADELTRREEVAPQGTACLRVVATSPATAGMLRVGQLVAALARRRLWLADAYFAGTPAYVQALCAAARDGVDVRLLVPNSSDIPLLKPLSRAGYRVLLAAGVRVFEWNGTMMHAKTAVADGHWARVGSTNLNVSSWFGNYEMDIVADDEPFALAMEQAFVGDLASATELFVNARGRTAVGAPAPRSRSRPHAQGSAGRATAGVVRIGHVMGAAFAGSGRELEPMDARVTVVAGLIALGLAAVFVSYPRALAYPAAALLVWAAFAFLYNGRKARMKKG
jgi:cardiolipin synthase